MIGDEFEREQELAVDRRRRLLGKVLERRRAALVRGDEDQVARVSEIQDDAGKNQQTPDVDGGSRHEQKGPNSQVPKSVALDQ